VEEFEDLVLPLALEVDDGVLVMVDGERVYNACSRRTQVRRVMQKAK